MDLKKIQNVIDRMVAESIRRQLPQIMNEVLIKTIADSGVLSERRAPQAQRRAPVQERSMGSLRDLLDDAAGSEFYRDEPMARSEPALTQRLAQVPQHLREMLETVEVPDETDRGLDLAGMDGFFQKAKKIASITESSTKKPAPSTKEQLEFEERRLKNMRLRLNGGKPLDE